MSEIWLSTAPGRVNLIGDHTDYNGLPVFPMAIQRRVEIRLTPRADRTVRLKSADGYAPRSFEVSTEIEPYPAGDWGNYVKASAQAVARRYGVVNGMDALVSGNLPPAAGLSSSSALVVAAAKAFVAINGIDADFEALMEILPEGEQYVGTRGGGMDHAVCLGGEAGKAIKIDFEPVLKLNPTPVPAGWSFLIANSLVKAEKSSAVREQYNERRESCRTALQRLGARSYLDVSMDRAAELSGLQQRRYRHVISEAQRVEDAREAMLAGDLVRFGALMNASHESLREDFEVSHPEVDALVEAFLHAGAAGARVTGAGFGGCVVALCAGSEKDRVRAAVEEAFYASRHPTGEYLLEAEASAGARVERIS